MRIVGLPKRTTRKMSGCLSNEGGAVLFQGRVSAEDDKASKLILESPLPLMIARELWIQFDSREDYASRNRPGG